MALAELVRVSKANGLVLAAHYDRPTRMLGRGKAAFMSWVRSRLSRMERFSLLLTTGVLAATAHVPIFGKLVVKSGLAIRYPLMDSFKTTWTNTFDWYGNHHFQRYLSTTEFQEIVKSVRGAKIEATNGSSLRIRRCAESSVANHRAVDAGRFRCLGSEAA